MVREPHTEIVKLISLLLEERQDFELDFEWLLTQVAVSPGVAAHEWSLDLGVVVVRVNEWG